MPRELRNCIDEEMEKIQASHADHSRQVDYPDTSQGAQTANVREQDQRLQLAEPANCSLAQHSAADAAQTPPAQWEQAPSQRDTVQGNRGPSQNLELSLRDWAPPTASQVLAESQQQQDRPSASASDREESHASGDGIIMSRGRGASQGDCRDILDTAAPGEPASD